MFGKYVLYFRLASWACLNDEAARSLDRPEKFWLSPTSAAVSRPHLYLVALALRFERKLRWEKNQNTWKIQGFDQYVAVREKKKILGAPRYFGKVFGILQPCLVHQFTEVRSHQDLRQQEDRST